MPIARMRRKLAVTSVAVVFGMATFVAAAGCEASDDFDFRGSGDRMSRSGLYGPAASDAEREKIQEGYAKRIEDAKSAKSGG